MQVAEYRQRCRYIQSVLPAKRPVIDSSEPASSLMIAAKNREVFAFGPGHTRYDSVNLGTSVVVVSEGSAHHTDIPTQQQQNGSSSSTAAR